MTETAQDDAIFDVIVPQVGEAIADVTLVRWLKQVGDAVSKGEPLFEVDTEKATFEIEAFADGTLVEILAEDGSSVSPLQVVARLAEAGAPAQVAGPPAAVAEPAADAPSPQRARPRPAARAERVLATPRARRLAQELGVDLSRLAGSGHTVSVTDVERAATAQPAARPAARSERTVIAQRVQASKQKVPHFYLWTEIDMSAVDRLRTDIRTQRGEAPSITSLVVKASATVLAGDSALDVYWSENGVTPHATGGIGVATSTSAGVQVITISNAAGLPLEEIGTELREAVERARQGRLRPGDAAPKSMVVSNLGMHGIDAFFAIVDEPDPMILSVGRTVDKVVAVDGQPTVRPMATFGLSIDHRALDGVDGARFLSTLRELLEDAEARLA